MMPSGKMHADEVDIEGGLVRRLVAAQFPNWRDLPIEAVPSTGTANAIYRLGSDMGVRLPRVRKWARRLEIEYEWLPKLAPQLPLAIPEPLAKGRPGEGYPWPWAVYRWLTGETWDKANVRDLCGAATDLARFVSALHRMDPSEAPDPPGSRATLTDHDPDVRAAIAASHGLIDTDAVAAAWDTAVRAHPWAGPPVWIHSDLLPGNVLVAGGRLSAVIDFGGAHAGDPARDIMAAWTLFTGESRDVFRAMLSVDDATWGRARGWALTRVLNIPYYKDTNPLFVADARHTIDEVLADRQRGA